MTRLTRARELDRKLTVDPDFAAVRVGKHYRQSLEIVGGPL